MASRMRSQQSKPMVRRNYQLGFWPQRGRLDRYDEALSLPVMRLELPMVLEFAVAVPGTFFGLPPMAWGLLPLFVGWMEHDPAQLTHPVVEPLWLVLLCLPLSAFALWSFFKVRV